MHVFSGKVNAPTPQQLELDLGVPPTTWLPPCGRPDCPCEAIVEPDQYRCNRCGCVAPRKRTPTFFDGFIRSQLKFLHRR